MIGTQIGPFVVLRLLGAGGMGSVYLAEHSLMKDLHAIKILDPQLTQNPQLVTRFVNEARAAAKLRHRNLVRVHNVERMANDGPWFMVLDYLEGHTLGHLMAHGGPMPLDVIVHILAQVANCIQHVHDHNIVHRDLKPDNIFLIRHDDDPRFPVVLDLGVAQLGGDLASGPATKTGTVIGTPIYMAPEQLRGERVSPAADVFALGVIAYELSTGFLPFQYDEPPSEFFDLPATEIYYRQRTAPPYDPRRRNPALGDAWVRALYAALALDPRMRPPSVRAFALELAGAVAATKDSPGGLAIVHQVARELTQNRSRDFDVPAVGVPAETARMLPVAGPDSHRTVSLGKPQPPIAPVAVMPERTTLRAPLNTLDGFAAQSVADTPPLPRWRTIAGGASAALVVGAAAAFAVSRLLVAEPSAPAAAAAPALSTHTAVAAAASSPAPVPPAAASSPAPAAASSPAPVPPAATGPAPVLPAASSPAPVPPAATGAAPGPAVATPPTTARSPSLSAAPPVPPPQAPRRAPARPDPASRAGATPAQDPHSSVPLSGTAKRTGQLAIIVRPWALIWLNGRNLGQTPFREAVPAGRYRLRISNEDAGKDETTFITVNPDQTTTVQRIWQ